MLNNLIFPSISYALTSGPTQPEASSFEPVDTSDMVNLQTGDMTYNIPLLEVPGPEGGYPLSLAYHAGIQTNADASWVGLGWSLNPGAITRDVNGYPDDYSRIQQTTRDFWAGGSTSVYQFGVNIGITGSPASISVGLSVANDTYKGFGVGIDVGIGSSYGPIGISASVGINPYGGAYAGASASIGLGLPVGSNMAMGVSGSFNLSTNFKSVDAGISSNGGISYSSGGEKPLTHSLLGYSIASNSNKPSLSVGGITASTSNVNSGRIQTSSSGFGISIPIVPMLGVYVGKRKTRYWSDETINVKTHGVLDMQFSDPVKISDQVYQSGFQDNAYDVYHLPDNANYNMVDNPDNRVALGGTLPDNDYYNVTAQGLGGNIRPYAYQEELYIQDDKFGNNNEKVEQDYAGPINPPHYSNSLPINYRFVNDFSNRFIQSSQDFSMVNVGYNYLQSAFDQNPIFGLNDNNYGYQANTLYGSKHIDYEYNVNLNPSTTEFYNLNPTAQGFVRKGTSQSTTDDYSYQIGGFRITNESGVTYHYMLPAYTGASYTYTRKKNDNSTFNMQKKNTYYAYAWYLSGVTGPDYVDANNNNIIDEGDWGYWVSFEYGKWCDDYIWRNPEQGFQPDLDNSFEMQSAGKKEIYYLNKIKTATHSAVFVKSVRNDGKGASSTTSKTSYGNYDLYDGGFDATSKSTLRLDNVLILKNPDANLLTTSAGSVSGHYAQNIFDVSDITTSATNNSLRSINFNYDYSLCPNTTNSYVSSNISSKTGKLTLTSLETKGKGGATILPPTKFDYELTGTDIKQQTVSIGNVKSSGDPTLNFTSNAVYSKGDILKFTYSSVVSYCVVKAVNSSSYSVVYMPGATEVGSGIGITVANTKNPGYSRDCYDIWNNYKSDYDPINQQGGENFARATSSVSAPGEDAWSLRTITSSLGNKTNISYEPDSYNNAVLEQSYKIQLYLYNYYDAGTQSFIPPLSTYTSHTNNLVYYKLRNPEVFDNYSLQLGQRFDAVVWWRKLNDCNNSNAGATCYAIDTKQNSSYFEIADLSYFSSQGIIGFKLYNVLSTVSPGQNPCAKPDFANLLFNSVAMPKNTYGGNIRVKSISVTSSLSGITQTTNYDYNSSLNVSLSSGITSFEPTVFDDASFLYFNPQTHQFFTPNANETNPNVQADYRKKLAYYNGQLLSLTREVPPPGVMYKNVTISNSVKNSDEQLSRTVEGKTTYQFTVFSPGMIGIQEISKTGPVGYPGDTDPTYNTLEKRQIALKNYTTRIGNVESITRYDNNGQKLNETINSYLGTLSPSFASTVSSYNGSLSAYNQQGVIQENFTNIRHIKVATATNLGHRKAINTKREEYPSIMMAQTVTDYVSKTSTVSSNVEYDFYSGALTKKIDQDAYGNYTLSEVIPAYRIYPGMGLRTTSFDVNKNMLTQEAEKYTWNSAAPSFTSQSYQTGNGTAIGLVRNPYTKSDLISADVTTWSKSANVLTLTGNTIVQDGAGSNGLVWRSQAGYSWMPVDKTINGMTANSNFTNFNFSAPTSSDARWKKTSDITLYDVYSHALEAKDINGNYSARKMGYGSTKIVMSGTATNYNEICFSGAEDPLVNGTFGGGAGKGTGSIVSKTANNAFTHTGESSILCAPSQTAFTYSAPRSSLTSGRDYYVSVWAKSATGTGIPAAQLYFQRDGTTIGSITLAAPALQSGTSGWYLLTVKILSSYMSSGTTFSIYTANSGTSGNIYLDDFRFAPVNAVATAYVYDPLSGELTYMLNDNNLYTRFEYDAAGRLIRAYVEKFSTGEFKTAEYQYNYGKMH